MLRQLIDKIDQNSSNHMGRRPNTKTDMLFLAITDPGLLCGATIIDMRKNGEVEAAGDGEFGRRNFVEFVSAFTTPPVLPGSRPETAHLVGPGLRRNVDDE